MKASRYRIVSDWNSSDIEGLSNANAKSKQLAWSNSPLFREMRRKISTKKAAEYRKLHRKGLKQKCKITKIEKTHLKSRVILILSCKNKQVSSVPHLPKGKMVICKTCNK